MTKGRHPTFTSKRKVVKVKLQDKVVTLKEERIHLEKTRDGSAKLPRML